MRSIRGSKKAWAAARAKSKKPAKFKMMNCYRQRNAKIGNLGYETYQKYLQSEEWKILRKQKLERYPLCLLCDKPASQVHHISYDYETLLGLFEYRLIQLCDGCHEKIEFTGSRKNSLKEANAALFYLAGQTPRGQRWIEWFGHRAKERLNSPNKLKKSRRT